MDSIRQCIFALGPWRRRGLAVLLGVAAALALPPLHFVPLLVPAFTGLYWMIRDAKRPQNAFAAGWWFGFGFFLAGLYWIGIAFFVDPGRHGAMAVPAVLGLSAFLALYPGLAALGTRLLAVGGGGGVLVLAGLWTLSEWLRGWVFTGFPWNLIGSVWVFSDTMIQSTAYFGTYGLGLVSVAVAAMPAILTNPLAAKKAWILGALSVLALLWIGGQARLLIAGPAEMVSDVQLRLVQPNIPQRLKWKPDLQSSHIKRQLDLSVSPAGPRPTHIIWGETMAPLFLANEPEVLKSLGQAVPKEGLIIVGAPRTTARKEREFRIWNSLHGINSKGKVVGTYDKFHLVPFGEYIPFRELLPISKITEGTRDFSAGAGPVTLDLPGLPPVSPLICYEVIFPNQVTWPGQRPSWILNLTNDSWYGRSSGPYQHLAASRLRAVEEGLPLVRVANGGISAVIDAHGRVLNFLGLGRAGVVDSPLPKAIPSTVYGSLGFTIVLLFSVISCILGLSSNFLWTSNRG